MEHIQKEHPNATLVFDAWKDHWFRGELSSNAALGPFRVYPLEVVEDDYGGWLRYIRKFDQEVRFDDLVFGKDGQQRRYFLPILKVLVKLAC